MRTIPAFIFVSLLPKLVISNDRPSAMWQTAELNGLPNVRNHSLRWMTSVRGVVG